MFIAYRLLTFFFYPFIILIIYLRIFLKKENKKRYKEKIFSSAFNSKKKLNKKLIWFHASSIGELLSIIPLIDNLNNLNKNLEFLITTVTISSANLLEKKIYKYNNVTHRFFPIDTQFLADSFLNKWQPDLICFVDSEIWPNFLFKIKERKIPLVLLNARITKKTFRKWKIFPEFAKENFSKFDLCLASSDESKNNLKQLGAKNIIYLGNLKFCSKINYNKISDDNKSILDNFKVWCAASTHKGEEEIIIKSHKIIKKRIKNIKTIIVPRHISRIKDIKSLIIRHNLKSQVLNECEKIDKDAEIIIINSFGVLEKYYEYCNIVFIGKSLLKKFKLVGGQNPIEPAKLGCKILYGPYVYNFDEIYKFLNANEFAFQITNEEELSIEIIKNFEHKNSVVSLNTNNLEEFGKKILKDTIDSLKKYIN